MMSKSPAQTPNLTGRILHAMARSSFARQAYTVCRHIPVLGPLAHASVDRLLPHGTRAWARLPDGLGKGLWFNSDPRFELGYCNGDHEPWVQELLQKHLRQGDCFYDIGGHTGFFSLIAARFVGEKGSVVAVEADPENAQLLRVNASRNHMAQINVLEAAAWSSCGWLCFERAGAASNRTEGHVVDSGNGQGGTIRVSAVSLDHLVSSEGLRAPQLLKIDVEGAEWEVLQGTTGMLRAARPRVLCEVHDPQMIEEIRSFLADLGYLTEHWQPRHPRYADYKQHYVWGVPNAVSGE